MWGTDLTSVMTGEGQAAVFIAVDHCSAECVGIHASRSADRFQALEPVWQAVRQCYGGFAKGIAAGLRLRHDHGSQYVSHDFQAESASSASKARRRSFGSRKGTAAPSGTPRLSAAGRGCCTPPAGPPRRRASGRHPAASSRRCGSSRGRLPGPSARRASGSPCPPPARPAPPRVGAGADRRQVGLGRLQRLRQGRGVAPVGGVDRGRDDGPGVEIDRVLGLVGEAGATVLQLGDPGFGIDRRGPVLRSTAACPCAADRAGSGHRPWASRSRSPPPAA